MGVTLAAAEAVLGRLPDLYPGPGGVAGLVHQGRVVAARAWGHATFETARQMTRATALPICSITKQFTCAAFLGRLDPAAVQGQLAAHLPRWAGPLPSLREMMANQSGLRDYWALAPLLGARPDGEFRRSDGPAVYGRMATGHFAPGTSYSYCNQNFRILADILQEATGRDLAEIYAADLFGPAGMAGARLSPDTACPPEGVTGYEGTADTGHFPAVNRLYWKGDAGITASLDDMLAWEAHLDATRDDPGGVLARIGSAPAFRDGAASGYGQGLAHEVLAGGARAVGHGGALRGFRAHRLHVPAQRLSAVVMFNHEADAHGAAAALLEAALGAPATAAAPVRPVAGLEGVWMDAESGLSARVEARPEGAVLRHGTRPEVLPWGQAGAESASVSLSPDGPALRMRRPGENLDRRLQPLAAADPAAKADLDGLWHWAELDAWLRIETRDGATHATASGHFGQAQPERVHPLGRDCWLMPVRRSVDAPAPGDWTLRLTRDAAGRPSGLRVGCWLARGLDYRRVQA